MDQRSLIVSLILAMSIGTICGHAAQPSAVAATPQTTGGNPLREAYYGDLHLHTSLSLDAYMIFGTKVTPDEAYRFAKGEAVSYMGQAVRRKWPLDFLAVTDHSENMGVLNDLDDPNSVLSRSEIGQKLKVAKGADLVRQVMTFFRGTSRIPGYDPKQSSKSAWQKEIEAARKHYQPGKFTSFVAYEWSSIPSGNNLHRNIIFLSDNVAFPFSSIDSPRPEDLWTYLEQNRKGGIEALAIPHNANASGGLMYDWNDSDGKPIDQVYAQRRVLNEPISEIVQTKGQSETHPTLSANDEFANFELFDHLLVGNRETAPSAAPGSYVRDALGRGLVIESRTGTNPYKFGVAGGTDFHNGLTTSDEDSFDGNAGGADPGKKISSTVDLNEIGISTIDTGSGALTGVWAEQNTRESIYAALRRKETFATSGTRLKFRFFGGWNYAKSAVNAGHWVESAYAHGVPMGGDLPAMPSTAKAPKFVVWALKDPNGANLDRVQIVKVWLKNGKHEEKVFDVAYAGKHRLDPATGKLQPVGNTVDLKTATYRNNIGATTLRTVWEDSEFDAKVPAVYYLRVIEIPTPRWSTILAVKNGLAPPPDAPASIQERGWSSPIWYTPVRPAS